VDESIRLKDKYALAKCCLPRHGRPIVGYFSYDDVIKVHRRDCPNLAKAEPERLIDLDWADILQPPPEAPAKDFGQLDDADFKVLEHHETFGVDYSLKVARQLNLPRQTAFDRHHKLRDMGLLCRVEPVMIQYRKGVVDNKWIKHRNHTYYELTEKGRRYLAHHRNG
jgi:hypothetical protein